ncbi:MAG: DUF3990 domain-containing protein [Saccharofermentanales bacterium]
MRISETIKEIRNRLNLSQKEMAAALGVTFATVNRWENDHSEPAKIAIKGIRALCEKNHIEFSEFEGNPDFIGNEKVILYHGSKSGINGVISPISRELCDFGKGFYMGTEKSQPLTLICNFPKAKIYTVEADITGLHVLDIEVGIDWALLIAFNRGKMENIKDSAIYNKYRSMSKNYDLVIGYIANDRMFVVLDRFFSGDITDVALINSLSALKLGRQYVAITKKACGQIRIIEEKEIGATERDELRLTSEKKREEGIAKADEICKKYRRDGRFFDEIIGGGV